MFHNLYKTICKTNNSEIVMLKTTLKDGENGVNLMPKGVVSTEK